MPQDFFQRPRRRFGEKDLSPLVGPARTLERVTQYIQRQGEDEAIREALGQIQRVRARSAGLPPYLRQDTAEELPALGVLATRGGARGQALLGAVTSTTPKQDMTMTPAELAVAASQYGEPYEGALRRMREPTKPERWWQPSGKTETVEGREYQIEEEIERGLGPTKLTKRGGMVTQPSELDAALKESLLRQREKGMNEESSKLESEYISSAISVKTIEDQYGGVEKLKQLIQDSVRGIDVEKLNNRSYIKDQALQNLLNQTAGQQGMVARNYVSALADRLAAEEKLRLQNKYYDEASASFKKGKKPSQGATKGGQAKGEGF